MVGAGGVAKAIGLAVKDLGGKLTICNRNYNRAKSLSKLLNVDTVRYNELNSFKGYLLINATSVGMNAPTEMVVEKDTIENFDAIMDAVIYPAKTKLLTSAFKIDKITIPGTLMCVYQAAEQFRIYTGMNAPIKIIDKTIKDFD